MYYFCILLILSLFVGCSNKKVVNNTTTPNSEGFTESAIYNAHPVEYSYEHFTVEGVIYETINL